MPNKRILLLEPGYKNKYPPLGLMKIAQYHGPQGKNDKVRFIKGEDRTVLSTAWDRVYVTTLLCYYVFLIQKYEDRANDRVRVAGRKRTGRQGLRRRHSSLADERKIQS